MKGEGEKREKKEEEAKVGRIEGGEQGRGDQVKGGERRGTGS